MKTLLLVPLLMILTQVSVAQTMSLNIDPQEVQIVAYKNNIIFDLKDKGRFEQYICPHYDQVSQVKNILLKILDKARKLKKEKGKTTLSLSPFNWNPKKCRQISEELVLNYMNIKNTFSPNETYKVSISLKEKKSLPN